MFSSSPRRQMPDKTSRPTTSKSASLLSDDNDNDGLAPNDDDNDKDDANDKYDDDKYDDDNPLLSMATSSATPTHGLSKQDAESYRAVLENQFQSVNAFDLDIGGDEKDKNETFQRVTYKSSSHISVLTQMHGSVWPSVLPFCLVNVLITYAIGLAKRHGLDLTFPTNGHNFMAIMVSFLVVTRVSITYGRFMEARGYLSTTYRTCRELIHTVSVLTMDSTLDKAKEWRQKVAFQTICLLRITMAALDYKASKKNTWEVLPESMREKVEVMVELGEHESVHKSVNSRLMRWAHGERTLTDENFRAPLVVAYNLRAVIMGQRNTDALAHPMHVNEEMKILGFVAEFVTAFHGLKKLITTPFPFPLVQMARTFLFFWVFTLGFCLEGENAQPVQVMIIIFFITFGFVGLEYVSMEMDDPFGDDPNDFDDVGMAQMVFEDIYITVYKTDGGKWAENLRKKVTDRVKKGGGIASGVETRSKRE